MTKTNYEMAIKNADKAIDNMRMKLCAVENSSRAWGCNRVYDEIIALVAASERAALACRQIPLYTGRPNANEQMNDQVREVLDIRIGSTEQGWFSLQLPSLLPKRGEDTTGYLKSSLFRAMENYFNHNERPMHDDCVIVICNVYDRQLPERHWRDHDNIEYKAVADMATAFLLKDDKPKYCRHYLCSYEGDSSRTQVYVVPRAEMPNWFDASRVSPPGIC